MGLNIGQRIFSARKMAGLSLQELSDKMKNIISKQALSKYEKGQINPNSNVLISIANVLGIKLDYFFRESKIKIEGLEFRKKASISVKELESIKQKTIDLLERAIELDQILNLSLSFDNPIKNNKIACQDDIEKVVENIRDVWKLGLDAIPNVIELLEEQSIKIFEIESIESFDGLACWVNKIPVIIVNKDFVIERKRFTILHEFAHLILKFENQKEGEKLCHAFASAFLIPKEIFFKEFHSRFRNNITLQELIGIKEQYGISIQAIMARAKTLELISDNTYKKFCIEMSKKNYRKKEPGNFQGKETSYQFRKLLYYAASEEIISLNKAADLANLPLADFEKEFTLI